MRTDDLVRLLSQDPPVSWTFGRIFGTAAMCGTAVAGLLFFLGIGFRPDIASAVQTARFLFKFVVTFALALGAAGAALRAGRPGVRPGSWWRVILAAPVLLATAAFVELLVVPEDLWSARLVGNNARNCLTLIPLLSIGPLACLLVALRQGAPTRPGLAGALAGLAASGIAATFYAANCTDDSALFVATWYPIAVMIVTATGYLVGRNILRW